MSSLPSNSLAGSTERSSRSAGRSWTGTAYALVGGLLVWLAFPPVGAAPLAWLGTAVWIWLCSMPRRFARRDYLGFYLAALLHWMLVIHWTRLPHWSAWFGWVALSAYLAVYLPLFIALVRQARRLGAPLVLAAPIVWCGLEAIRARALTGFAIALLGHTQVKHTALIQIADLFGAYSVSFLIVLVAAAAGQLIPRGDSALASADALQRTRPRVVGSVLLAVLALVGTFTYGRYRLGQSPVDSEKSIRVALIQGSIDTEFDGHDNTKEILGQYVELSQTALAAEGPFDLIVWPESMYAYPWISVDTTGAMHVPERTAHGAAEYRRRLLEWERSSAIQAQLIAGAIDTPLLAGAPRWEYGPEPVRRFNSALHFAADGMLIDSYDKMHPVLFGEYIPLGNIFPWLYRFSPMDSGLVAGLAAKCLSVGGVQLSPSICFENTVPHLLRRQYIALRAQGVEPDALVTITNDGWFWGSSLLDVHLACGVFRAIELRRPLLIAANTGFSAWIDARGRVLAQGPRRATGSVVATVTARGPSTSVYLAWGDGPVGVCSALCGLLAIALWRQRKSES